VNHAYQKFFYMLMICALSYITTKLGSIGDIEQIV
jgi:hypothetical protein